MRIAINAAVYSDRRVGIEIFTEKLVSELSRRCELLVYTSLPQAFSSLPVQIRRIPEWTQGHIGRMIWSLFLLPARLRQDRADAVLSVSCDAPPSGRVPSVAVVHDLTPLRVFSSATLQYHVLFRFSLQLLRGVSAIVTGSEHTRDDIRRSRLNHGKPIRVIPHGSRFGPPAVAGSEESERQARAQLEELSFQPGRPFILYVGGFIAHKRVPLLVSAFRQLSQEYAHQLILVGWGPKWAMRELTRAIDESKMRDRISVFSGLPDSALAYLYSRCDLFVYPSRYEGFGLPVLEAMACGAPIVCSDSTSLPEVAGDSAVYFSSGSETELAAAMRAVLSDSSLRATLAEKGRRRAQQFTWSRAAAAYYELLSELAGPGRN